MKPENSQSTPNVEQLPMPPTFGPESVPSLPPLDGRFERGQQQVEQAAEAGARASDAAAAASAVAGPTVVPIPDPPVAADPVTTISATPLVAADEDLIEKEWVDKAKQIIEQTRDDPHARTQKVNELQRDYLQKRFGKTIGATD
ncbi:MAG: hypothetical protein WAR37_03095 [Candidatus Microsaccharimonas sp.]